MKKALLLALCAVAANLLSAQRSVFVVSPTTQADLEISFQGEAMSPNHHFVVGENTLNVIPAMWNTTNGTMVFVSVSEGDGMMKTGSFHAVNDNGMAVGDLTSNVDYLTRPIMASIYDNGAYTELYTDSLNDAGATAYGITNDGSVIVGFHYDVSWATHACIWTNNGTVRTDLPEPTAEQMGIEFDYVSARWISGDGNVILGYAQDSYSGNWVAMAWRKSATGTYEPVCFSDPYFQLQDDLGENPKPYFQFEPTSLSQDGNWVGLIVMETFDLDDWDYTPIVEAARYNLSTGDLEVLSTETPHEEMHPYGIANDGTVAGRMLGETDPATWAQSQDGFIWTNGNNMETLRAHFADDPYLDNVLESHCMGISADARFVLGYTTSTTGELSTYIVALDGTVGIEEAGTVVKNPRYKGIYDIYGRKLDAVRGHGIYIIDGVKVVR